MSATISFDFSTRPLVPLAHDYPHGATEPWHFHRCAQLIHTLSGVVRVETEQGSWVVPPSRGVWLPAMTRHSLQITGAVAARVLFVDPLARADLPASCQVVQISALLRALIVSAMDLPVSYAPASRAERIYELILDEIRGMDVLPFALPVPDSPRLQALCMQIQAEPAGDWTLARASEWLNVSGRTLARHFERETGLYFSEWVRRARVAIALTRLAQGDPVLQVALDLGYESPGAFSAMFRRVLGVAPTDYFPAAESDLPR
ncbi:AraC-like DNA-binding protein [Pantoea sp. PNA 14-12]|uniref:AraC family transcriptional regulator n=1 Tax=Pantoea TaxID=53335 RepID=UPI000D772DFC|nr:MULTISPECIES: helix-turn-helix transcriptional regulator [Pantoea]MDF7784959.1 helix-turn-helix transcriptional regulator [Pantoea stewartii]PXV78237.1 AraC-like DNA-binding protein [Pantoea sp. PNA 03-3]QIE95716.1 AraC family transcriptional regulator [Pantoea stewartii]TDS72303.1 AraC-like DNA-binding protein [Pantoea sp. PNA 14-12]